MCVWMCVDVCVDVCYGGVRYALLEASRELRADKAVVLAAVTQTGNALR